MTVKLSRTAEGRAEGRAARQEQRPLGLEARALESLTATASGRSLTRPRQARPQPREGPYRVTATIAGAGKAHAASACEHLPLGVLAFGDSITNGGGELQWGVALQSWALWVARGLGLPFTTYAVDGARAARRRARAGARRSRAHGAARTRATTSAACTSASTTCARPTGTRAAFAADHATALAALARALRPVLLVTIPLDLGRPRAGARVERGQRDHRGRGARARRARARPARLRRAQPGDDRPRAPDRVRAGVDRRARARRARRRRDGRARAAVDADPPRRAHARCARCRATGPTSTGALKESGSGSACRGSGAPSCSSRLGT